MIEGIYFLSSNYIANLAVNSLNLNQIIGMTIINQENNFIVWSIVHMLLEF